MAHLYRVSVLSLGFLEAALCMKVTFESHVEHNFLSYWQLLKQEPQTANNVPDMCLPPSPLPLPIAGHCHL